MNSTATEPELGNTRWVQLILGLIVMMAISSPQYVWTLFVKSFGSTTGASLPAIQITFSLLIVLQTWLSPASGWLIDRFGTKLLIAIGAALSGLGWVLSAHATSLTELYLTYGLFCGVGTGIVYIGIIGHMVRWFPDRRGFATGMVAAGYGFGAVLTTFPIATMLKSSGYQSTLVTFGIILGAIGVLAAFGLRKPQTGETAATKISARVSTAARNYSPKEMLKTPIFWLMFIMMTMMSTSGLMVISQFANFMRDFGIHDTLVWGLAALPLALTVDRITNGLTRPFFGWVSDNIGRENTMAIAFILEGCAITLLMMFRQNALAVVLLSGVVFFGWGEIFSLFPSTLTDTYGTQHATTNYGFLYMAQGVGSILGAPVAAWLRVTTDSWLPVFGVIIVMDILAGLLALLVLKPWRVHWFATAPSRMVPAETVAAE